LAWLAVFTMEVALVLPLLLGLYEWISKEETSWKKIVERMSIFGLAGVVFVVVRFGWLAIGGRSDYLFHSLGSTMLVMVQALVKYWQLLFWPINLTINHELTSGIWATGWREIHPERIPVAPGLSDPGVLLAFGVIGMTGAWFWKSRRKNKMVGLAIGWFYVALLPVMQLVPLPIIFSEEHLYLASAGVCLAFGGVMIALDKSFKNRSLDISRLIGVVVVVIMSLLGWRTIMRNADWKSDGSLWTKEMEMNPDSVLVNNSLGRTYFQQGKYEEAKKLFERSVKLNPSFARSWTNLGLTQRELGELEEARKTLEAALELEEEKVDVLINLGAVEVELNDYERAEKAFDQVLKLNPRSDHAYVNLAAIRMQQDNLDEAKKLLQMALELNPKNVSAQKNLELIEEYEMEKGLEAKKG